MHFGGQFERRKPAPAQLHLWQASFFFSLVDVAQVQVYAVGIVGDDR